MKVIYVDNHLLIVDKPAGLSTQPDENGSENLTDQAKAWIKEKYRKPGNVFLEPIHRLDKPVSGLVLFARTSKALSRLQEMMRNRQIEKTYYAFVSPQPKELEAVLEHYLVHEEYRARVVSSNHPGAKLARLSYRVVAEGVLEVDLETGRYHQIRVQLAAHGSPIVGDEKYGSRHPWKKGQIALHHGKLSFSHPVTKVPLQCSTGEFLSNFNAIQIPPTAQSMAAKLIRSKAEI